MMAAMVRVPRQRGGGAAWLVSGMASPAHGGGTSASARDLPHEVVFTVVVLSGLYS
jgi:hypothetical protein